MQEELDELDAASTIVDQADALIDLVYFALGTLVELGVDSERLFDIVHRANITKLTSPRGRVNGDDGKVEKPEGWIAPETALASVIVETASRFRFLEATSQAESMNACLAMVLEALGTAPTRLDLAQWPLPALPVRTAHGRSMLILPTGSLSTVLNEAGITLEDDYIPPDMLDEPAFYDILESGLATHPALMLAFDTGAAYRETEGGCDFALVIGFDDRIVRLLDPTPGRRGLTTVNVDDLLVGMRRVWHGIHRLRPGGTP